MAEMKKEDFMSEKDISQEMLQAFCMYYAEREARKEAEERVAALEAKKDKKAKSTKVRVLIFVIAFGILAFTLLRANAGSGLDSSNSSTVPDAAEIWNEAAEVRNAQSEDYDSAKAEHEAFMDEVQAKMDAAQ